MKNSKPRQNIIEENGVNVKVIVRCRPLTEQEKKDPNNFNILQTKIDTKEVVVSQQILGRKIDSYSTKLFSFDGVCGSFTSQRDLFKQYVVPIVDEVLLGFNCTIFAYGQTGTGKTYTMEGDMKEYLESNNMELTEHAGIIPRAVQLIFERLESQYTEYGVRVSYLEIYNEELSDLLSDEKLTLRIYDDMPGKRGLNVDRLEEIPVNKAQDILNILSTAVRKRKTAETLLNKSSSRSHCIFTITIHTKETNIDGEDVLKVGKLNLVDLAGSENIQRSGANAVKDRAKEAGMINQSLLTLGRVINALVDHSTYVPYRDSKLTRLLQDSLGGKTKTCIIATITSSSLYLEETLNTLDYAHRAKNIKNMPVVNQKMTKKVMIREMNCEIEKLKQELQCNREKNGVYLPLNQFNEMESKIQSQANDILELESEIQNQNTLFKEMEDNLNDLNCKLNEKMLRVKAGDFANIHIKKHAKLYHDKYNNLYSQLLEALKSIGRLHRKIISSDLFYSTQSNQVYKLYQELTDNIHNIDTKVSTCYSILNNEIKDELSVQWLEKTKLSNNEILNIIDTGRKLCNNVYAILDEALGKSLSIELSLGINNISENILLNEGKNDTLIEEIHDNINKSLINCSDKGKVIENNITDQLEKLKKSNNRCLTLINDYKNKISEQEEAINDIFNDKLINKLNSVTDSHLNELDTRLNLQVIELNKRSQELKTQFNSIIDSFMSNAIDTLTSEKEKITNDIEEMRDNMKKEISNCYKINKNILTEVGEYSNMLKDSQNKLFQDEYNGINDRINELNDLYSQITSLHNVKISNNFGELLKIKDKNTREITDKLSQIKNLCENTIQNSIKNASSVIDLQSNSYNELNHCLKEYFDFSFNNYKSNFDNKMGKTIGLLKEINNGHSNGDEDTVLSKISFSLINLENTISNSLNSTGGTPSRRDVYSIPKIKDRCLSPSKYVDYYLNSSPKPNIDFNQIDKMPDPFYNSDSVDCVEKNDTSCTSDEIQTLSISNFIQDVNYNKNIGIYPPNTECFNDESENQDQHVSNISLSFSGNYFQKKQSNICTTPKQELSVSSIKNANNQSSLALDENINTSQENSSINIENISSPVSMIMDGSALSATIGMTSIPKPTKRAANSRRNVSK
ncbi:kinesin-like boursin [Cryptosporidium ryanae]|uniref:kinesin-like boursin n=1 Tax=Cryptosporidium ryanae TaxID=515981 RepID=UPI00351A134C|nr:kinesin-like boursin [Cryptosporidium ryanae]